MNELFGISMNAIMVVLVAVFALSVLSIGYVFIHNRMMVKIGLRNLVRRRLQTGLIVVGLMLATLIISAAFTTGDTIDKSISGLAYSQFQHVDLAVNPSGNGGHNVADAPTYLSEDATGALEQRFAGDKDIESFVPFLFEQVAAADERTKLSEPSLMLSGIDAARFSGGLHLVDGGRFDVSNLGPDDILLNERGADQLDALVGDQVVLHANGESRSLNVVGIVKEEVATGSLGAFDDINLPGGAAMLLPTVQAFTGHEGQINYLTATIIGGVHNDLTLAGPAASRVETYLRSGDGQALIGANPNVKVDAVKQDAVDMAEQSGNMFTSFFIIFGMFSIAAGIMLIFMIFVMLAAERKAEMGMARAVGAQRSNLIQSFLSEGMSYNVLAGAVGAGLGVGASIALVVGYLRWSLGHDYDFVTAHVTARSLIISYCLGTSLTFLTVVIASVKVSSVNIVAAIRGTLEDDAGEPRVGIRWLWVLASIPAMVVPPLGLWVLLRKGFHVSWAMIAGVCFVLIGVLAVYAANHNGSEMMFSTGFCLIPLSLAIMAAHWKAPARLTWTALGAFLAAYWLSPVSVGEKLLGRELHGDIEMFVVSGVMVVLSFTLIIVFNAKLLTGILQRNNGKTYRKAALAAALAVAVAAVGFTLGDTADGAGQLCYLAAALTGLVALLAFAAARLPGLAPALKMGVAYPLSNRFRTGMTIAMFSMIIFSLTTFSSVTRNFQALISGATADGGWDVVATVNRDGQIDDLRGQLDRAGYAQSGEIAAVGRATAFQPQQQVREAGHDAWSTYPVIGVDGGFLSAANAVLDARASTYQSDRAVYDAVASQPDLALLDWNATQADNGNSYDWFVDPNVKDDTFEPFPLEVRDANTGAQHTVTVVGVLSIKLSDRIVGGVYVNQAAYEQAFGAPAYRHAYVELNEGVSSKAAARGIEAALSTQGIQADSITALLDEANRQNVAFTRMFQAFMALGLFVGIAALGVIAFRSVVERRQQVGMLRAIGFQRHTVALTFVLESSFVALMGILSGVAGGAIVSHNLFTTGQFSDANITFTMPWLEVIGFVTVAFAVSLLMTWWPSRNAAAVPVADALRYE